MADGPLIRTCALLAGALLLAGCTAGAWIDTSLSLKTCMQRAHLALRDSDFTERFGTAIEPEGEVAFGRHGSYHAAIHCFTDRRGVDIRVRGPDPRYTKLYRYSISRRF
jgi:hypothetical protein